MASILPRSLRPVPCSRFARCRPYACACCRASLCLRWPPRSNRQRRSWPRLMEAHRAWGSRSPACVDVWWDGDAHLSAVGSRAAQSQCGALTGALMQASSSRRSRTRTTTSRAARASTLRPRAGRRRRTSSSCAPFRGASIPSRCSRSRPCSSSRSATSAPCLPRSGACCARARCTPTVPTQSTCAPARPRCVHVRACVRACVIACVCGCVCVCLCACRALHAGAAQALRLGTRKKGGRWDALGARRSKSIPVLTYTTSAPSLTCTHVDANPEFHRRAGQNQPRPREQGQPAAAPLERAAAHPLRRRARLPGPHPDGRRRGGSGRGARG